MKSFSHARLFVSPWTVAYQVPLSMGFSRQEYWSGLPLPSPCSQLLKNNSFICVWLGCVFTAQDGFSLAAASRGCSLVCEDSHCGGFSCGRARVLGHAGFSSCTSWVLEHRLNSRGAWLGCPAACRHVESFWTTDQICVPCIDKQILYHWDTSRALFYTLLAGRTPGQILSRYFLWVSLFLPTNLESFSRQEWHMVHFWNKKLPQKLSWNWGSQRI